MNFYKILNVRLRVLPGEITFVQINAHYVVGKDNIAEWTLLFFLFATVLKAKELFFFLCNPSQDFFFVLLFLVVLNL